MFRLKVVSFRTGVRKSKGRPLYVHPSNRNPSRTGLCSGVDARVPVFTLACVGVPPSAGSKRTVCAACASVLSDGLAVTEPALSGVPAVDDGVPGDGVPGVVLNGVVVCIGDGEDSGVLVALLGRVAEVPSDTRGV